MERFNIEKMPTLPIIPLTNPVKSLLNPSKFLETDKVNLINLEVKIFRNSQVNF